MAFGSARAASARATSILVVVTQSMETQSKPAPGRIAQCCFKSKPDPLIRALQHSHTQLERKTASTGVSALRMCHRLRGF